jgi:RNA polymerase sigma factor (sigma-70 family)
MMMTGNEEVAADLSQEALVRAYRAWHRIRERDAGPYVRRILVNLVRNAHRRRLVELRHQRPVVAETSSHDTRVEDAMRVAEALEVLSPVRKATILLRYYEDMSEAQIAEVLDRPLNTVKSDIRRALEKMRPLLDEGATAV